MDKVIMVKFECPNKHQWKDPMPTENAQAMAALFGSCPTCKEQGTVK